MALYQGNKMLSGFAVNPEKKSAYEAAQLGGYKGTEEEFNEFLASAAEGPKYKKIYRTEVFTESTVWTVPVVIDNAFHVTLVGGGGNGSAGSGSTSYFGGGGGGGGYINIDTVVLDPLPTVLDITVGGAGGITSFGEYLSASGGGKGVTASLNTSGKGGDGGSGGGAGGYYKSNVSGTKLNGGTGSEYGGAGGSGGGRGTTSATAGEPGIDTTNFLNEYLTGTGAAGAAGTSGGSSSVPGGGGGGGYGGVGGVGGTSKKPSAAGGGGGGGYGGISIGGAGASISRGSGIVSTEPIDGLAGSGYGSGGGGGAANTNSSGKGGAGAPGLCVIRYAQWELT